MEQRLSELLTSNKRLKLECLWQLANYKTFICEFQEYTDEARERLEQSRSHIAAVRAGLPITYISNFPSYTILKKRYSL